MKPWVLVRFSAEEVAGRVVARLMRDLLPLALAVHNPDDVGVFHSDLGSNGKCIYFSPGAVRAFAPVLAKLPADRCDPPNPEALSLLYGARECLPQANHQDNAESPRVLRLEERID